MRLTSTNPRQEKSVRAKTASACTHGRMVDDVRSEEGAKTGRLVCKECQAKFPDPHYQNPGP
jgi:hypothetical protein